MVSVTAIHPKVLATPHSVTAGVLVCVGGREAFHCEVGRGVSGPFLLRRGVASVGGAWECERDGS
jgi:hypothetical protein